MGNNRVTFKIICLESLEYVNFICVILLCHKKSNNFRYKELFRNSNRNMFDTGMQFYELRRNEKQAYDIAVKEEMDRIQKAGNV